MDVFQIMGKLFLEGKEQFDKDINVAKEKGSQLASVVGKGLETVAKVGVAAVGVAATAITAMSKQSLDSYAEYEQLVGGSQLLFGDAYSFIADQAKNAYATVQMSQNEYLQQVNGFATGLKTALKGNEQAAAELAAKIIKAEADVVAATGNSQEAVQNAFNGIMKSNFTMLDNLQLGITPTKEGFKDLIKQVNAYNKTLGKTTNYQIDNLADCQAALVDYIEMQGLAGYASNEAAGTIQGSLAMVAASWQDLLVGFADGSQDLGVLIDKFVGSVSTAARNIVPKLAQILGGLTVAMAEIIPAVNAELPVLMEELLPGIIEGAVALVVGLIAVAPDLVNTLIISINQFITQKLPQMFPGLADNISAVQTWFADLGSYMAEKFAPIMDDAAGAFKAVKDAVKPVIDRLKAYTASGEAATDATNLLKDAIDFVAEAYQFLKDAIDGAATALQDAGAWVEAHQIQLEVLASAIGIVATALGAYTISLAIAKAGGIAALAADAALTVGYYALVAAEWAATAGATAFGAVMAFITSPITLVVVAIGAVIAIIVLCVKHWDEIKAKALEVAGLISGYVAEMVASIKEKFPEIYEKAVEIWGFLKGVFSDAVEVGKRIIDDIKQGISDAWEGLKSWFKGIWDGLFGNLSANVKVNASSSGTDGSHASGLDYVPFDGYIAELHKGEMVVPADEARMLRNGMSVASVDSGTADLLMMILETLQEFRNTETVMTLNNREFGRAVRRVVNV